MAPTLHHTASAIRCPVGNTFERVRTASVSVLVGAFALLHLQCAWPVTAQGQEGCLHRKTAVKHERKGKCVRCLCHQLRSHRHVRCLALTRHKRFAEPLGCAHCTRCSSSYQRRRAQRGWAATKHPVWSRNAEEVLPLRMRVDR